MATLRLLHLTVEMNEPLGAIEVQRCSERADIYALGVEGGARDISRGRDYASTQASGTRTREVGIQHVEAYPDGFEDIE